MGYPLETRDAGTPAASVLPPAVKTGRAGRSHQYVPWLVVSILIALWWLVSAMHVFTAFALPSPVRVVRDGYDIATAGYNGHSLLDNIGAKGATRLNEGTK